MFHDINLLTKCGYLNLCLRFGLHNSIRSILYLHYIILEEEVPLGNYTLPLSTAEVVEEGRHFTVTICVSCSLFPLNFIAELNQSLLAFYYF